jgi:DNA-binding response OmpR family regulator
MKILIADDDNAARRALRDLLQALDHRVVTAADGEQALLAFEAERPDLVLLDVEMPMLDGFDVARHIRAETPFDWIPIIFLSGRGEPAMVAEGIQAGGDDYLTKPVNLKVLLAKIDALPGLNARQYLTTPSSVPDAAVRVGANAEIRWFFPDPVISRRPDLFQGSSPALRTDWYSVPANPGCSVKLQTGRLDLKL